jgi:AraC family transcriptional regulator, exoenzyme S synthesis regulatory protein ExsA
MVINLYETIQAHPEYFKQLSCKELLFTQYDCPQMDRMQGLYSQNNFIAYVLSGKRRFYQPGYTIEMTAGKCVFAKKGGWIAEKEPGEGWCVLVFFIPDNYLHQFVTEYRANLPIKNGSRAATKQMLELDVNATTGSFFHSMISYFTQNPPPPESLLELKFRELIFNILINPANSDLLGYVCSINQNGKQPLQEIMEANFVYNVSLTEFAKISHRSLAAFKREFKEVFKTSPGKWLVQKRLDYAQLLLNTSAKPVNEIAFEAGFENTTHFSRVFKEKFGVSPMHFRQQQQPA